MIPEYCGLREVELQCSLITVPDCQRILRAVEHAVCICICDALKLPCAETVAGSDLASLGSRCSAVLGNDAAVGVVCSAVVVDVTELMRHLVGDVCISGIALVVAEPPCADSIGRAVLSLLCSGDHEGIAVAAGQVNDVVVIVDLDAVECMTDCLVENCSCLQEAEMILQITV